MSVIKKVLNKLKSGAWYPFYNHMYEHCSVHPGEIFIESRGGMAFDSNIFTLCRELNDPAYQDFKKTLVVKKNTKKSMVDMLDRYGITVDRVVEMGSLPYYYRLQTAEYLVNDTSFPGRFLKKEGQTYLNVWHGTPLKKMGKDNVEERYSMGNVMRNLLMSDYLLFPNSYIEEKMSEAYMLPNLYQGTILREGYPRNQYFFSEDVGKERKRALGYGDSQLMVYMPTFRGNVDDPDAIESAKEWKEHLRGLDALLGDDQILLVKLHPFVEGQVELGEYRHIRRFPGEYDTYDVLGACDVLITDYSSVLYDFAISGKKIILFLYDEASYDQDRGLYENVEEYPFHVARTVEAVADSLRKDGGCADEAFRKRYGTYEQEGAASRICRQVFLGETACQNGKLEGNGKKNILLYAGELEQNGITTAFRSMLEGLDLKRHNYYLSFRRNCLAKYPERLKEFPEELLYYPIASEMNLDILTGIAQSLYLKFGYEGMGIGKRLEQAYRREWKKHFGDSPMAQAVHYGGYENYIISLFLRAPAVRTIWVHNDMIQETRTKKNPSVYLLERAYGEYEHVIPVSEDIKEPTVQIGKRTDNVQVIFNCHDFQRVLERSREPIAFDGDTQSTISLEQLKEILKGTEDKFISIGRYSQEKGHKRLIAAFGRYWKGHPDTWLIIIGGNGALYEQTCQWAREANTRGHILLLKSVSNPMPILANCDLFLLSSHYEGLGLVLLEADTLGIPVMACEVNGPRGFLRSHGGILLEDSEEGLYQGMLSYSEGHVKGMHVDYAAENQVNILACERLFDQELH